MNDVIAIDISESQVSVAAVDLSSRHKLNLLEAQIVPISQKNLYQGILHSKNTIDEESNSSTENIETENERYLTNLINQALSKINHKSDSCILVIPPVDCLSFNLNLPFSDTKNIRQILDLEVQDTLAFDIDDFLIQHSAVNSQKTGNQDIFVSLIPKKLINFFIKVLKNCKLEPQLITTRSSILSGLYTLDDELAKANSLACLSIDNDNIALNIKVKGEVLSGKDFAHVNYSNIHELNEIKLNLSAFEKKYDLTFDKVVLIASNEVANKQATTIQQQLGRSIEVFNLKSYIQVANKKYQPSLDNSSVQHALLASAYSPEINSTAPLSNYRTREFAFNPIFKYIFENLRKMSPQFGLAAILGLLLLASIFISREYKIIRLYKSMNKQVAELNLNLTKGSEISELEKFNSQLDQQLASLGSPSQFSALDILLDLSFDIKDTKKRANGLEVREINIGPTGVVLSGSAREYSDVEKFEKELKKRKEIFCRIRRDTLSSNSQSRGFKFILNLCDS